jgi:hypothetical protein
LQWRCSARRRRADWPIAALGVRELVTFRVDDKVLTLDEQRIAEVCARDERILELENQLAAAQPRRDG